MLGFRSRCYTDVDQDNQEWQGQQTPGVPTDRQDDASRGQGAEHRDTEVSFGLEPVVFQSDRLRRAARAQDDVVELSLQLIGRRLGVDHPADNPMASPVVGERVMLPFGLRPSWWICRRIGHQVVQELTAELRVVTEPLREPTDNHVDECLVALVLSAISRGYGGDGSTPQGGPDRVWSNAQYLWIGLGEACEGRTFPSARLKVTE